MALVLVPASGCSGRYRGPWLDSSQRSTRSILLHRASQAEREAIQAAASEGGNAFQMFLEEFWLSRDPTPNTELNEYRNRFEARFIAARDSLVSPLIASPDARLRPWVLYGPPTETQILRHRDNAAIVIWIYRPPFAIPPETFHYPALSDLSFTVAFTRDHMGRHSIDAGNRLDDIAGGQDRELPFLSQPELLELSGLLAREDTDRNLLLAVVWRLNADPQPEAFQLLLKALEVQDETVHDLVLHCLKPLTVSRSLESGQLELIPAAIDTALWRPGYEMSDAGRWIRQEREGELESYSVEPDSLFMNTYLRLPYDPKEKISRDDYESLMRATSVNDDIYSRGWLKDAEIDSLYVGDLGRARMLLVDVDPMLAHNLLEPLIHGRMSDNPEAWHLESLALLESGKAGGRLLAEGCINTALRLDPGNLRYRLTQAQIMSRRTFDGYADRSLDHLLEDAPTLADAYALKARIRFEIVWQLGWRAGGWGSQLNARSSTRRELAIEALSLLNKALVLDRDNELATWWLATHFVQARSWVDVVPVMTYLLNTGVHQPEAYFGRGLAYQHLGMLDEALEDYTAGLALLPPQIRVLADDPAWAEPASRGGIGLAGKLSGSTVQFLPGVSSSRPDTITSPTPVSEERQAFWRGRDPLFSSPLNERQIEQYRRFAHVTWHFAVPNLGLRGWDTHRGRIYLRYGAPLTGAALELARKEWESAGLRVPKRFSYDQPLGGSDFMKIEYWFYDGFRIPFLVGMTTGNRIVPAPGEFEALTETVPESPHVIGARRVESIEARWYQFENEPGNLTFFCAPMLPDSGLADVTAGEGESLPIFASLLDEQWQEITRLERELSTVTGIHEVLPGLILSRAESTSTVVHGAFEITPPGLGPAYAARDTFQVASGDSLRLSSLVLATDVVPQSRAEAWPAGTYFIRGGNAIRPIPSERVDLEEAVYLYFEIYGLEKDAFGATQYELAVETTADEIVPERDPIIEALGRLLRREQLPGRVQLVFERQGVSERAVERNRIVFNTDAPVEAHQVHITITDLVSGSRVGGSIRIQIKD
ncbi:GWxTD domain-containing protein [Gemmatimonadota bacterium]